MRANTERITSTGAVAHVRAPQTTSSVPKPVAIAGARVARAGRDRIEARVTRAALIDAYVEPAITDGPIAFSVLVDGDETLVERGLAPFDHAIEIARRCERDERDPSCAAHLAAMILAAEPHARRALADDIEAAIRHADRAVRDSAEFALDLIDEAPLERRETVAERARSLITATREEKQPSLVLVARAAITVRSVARVAQWRISNESGWARLETEARSDSMRLHARCPHCRERRASWSLCDQCVEARCGRCARRCARCRRSGCARCSPTVRCGSCGLATMELVDES
jgi:hypothetical protein